MRTFLIVALSIGTLGGFSSGFRAVRHHREHAQGPCSYSNERNEHSFHHEHRRTEEPASKTSVATSPLVIINTVAPVTTTP